MTSLKTNSEIRAEARNVLGNKLFCDQFLYAVLACLIVSLINGAVAATGIGAIAAVIISGPLSAGLYAAFLSMVRTYERIKVESIFDGFKDFGRNILLGLMISIFTFLWTLLFIIPGIIKSYSYSMAFYVKKGSSRV